MGLFERFPYTNFHELNAGWMLEVMKKLEEAWEQFTAGNSLSFADPLTYDATKSYAKNTIVLDGSGNAYVSLQAVPKGVAPGNQDYWLMVFDYEAFIEKVNKNFTGNYYRDDNRAKTPMAVGDWLTLEDVLCKATAAIAVDDLLEVGVNIEHFTLEDFIKAFMTSANQMIQQYKNDIDYSELQYRNQLAQDIADTTASLQAQLEAAISGVTVDSEVINARVGADGITYPTLGDAIRTQVSDIREGIEGLNAIELPIFHNGYYINTTTQPVDLTAETANVNWKYCIFDCNAGDVFTVSGQGGSIANLVSWLDSSGNIISSYGDTTLTDKILEAPTGAVKLLINTKQDKLSIKGLLQTEVYKPIRDLSELGYTSLTECVEDGTYGCGSVYAASISDIPSECSGKAITVLNFVKAFNSVSPSRIRLQVIIASDGYAMTRAINQSNTTVYDWTPVGDSFRYRGALQQLNITDMKNAVDSGWYGFSTLWAASITDLPSNYTGVGGTLKVYYETFSGTPSIHYVTQQLTDTNGIIWERTFRTDNNNMVYDWHIISKNGDNLKKWCAVGDSITSGWYSYLNGGVPAQAKSTTECWAAICSRIKGLELTNAGIGSSGFIAPGSEGLLYNGKDMADNYDFTGYDLITISYGVNDWKYNYTLGSMADDKYQNTIYGAIKYTLSGINAQNPTAKIICIGPINSSVVGDYDSNWGINTAYSNSGTLQDVSDAIKEVCEYFGIEFVDMLHNSCVGRMNIGDMLYDNVHPTLKCHDQMAHELAMKINY